MKKIAVLIPIYKEPKNALKTLKNLAKCPYPYKEFFVIIDGKITQKIEEALPELKKFAKIKINNARLGKAVSLNRTAKEVEADILVFFDNDVEVSPDLNFFHKIAKKMQNADILEFPKEAIAKSPVSWLVAFEFIGAAVIQLILSNLLRRSPFINGAAFAVKKEVFLKLKGFPLELAEDYGFATKAFRKKLKFEFALDLKVKNGVPNTPAEWKEQRKRWALGTFYWGVKFFFGDIKSWHEKLAVVKACLVAVLPPFLTSLLLSKFVPGLNNPVSVFPLIFGLLQSIKLNFLSSGTLLIVSYILMYLLGITPVIGSFIVSFIFYFSASRVLGFRFNFLWFPVFHFVYMPLSVIFYTTVIVLNRLGIRYSMDWKV